MKSRHFFSLILLLICLTHVAFSAPKKTYLKGVVLVDAASKIQKESKAQVRGFRAYEVEVPGGIAELKSQLEPLFLNKPINADLLMSLRSHLLKYYRENNHPFITIKVPVQNFDDGIVQLVLEDENVPPEEFTVEDEPPFEPEELEFIPEPKKRKPIEKNRGTLTQCPLVPHLTTLVLVPQSSFVGQVDLQENAPFQVKGVQVPGRQKKLKRRLCSFFNQRLTQELIQSIKQCIIAYYRDHHHPVVTVITPEQDITDGVLYLVVMDGRLGELKVNCNQGFSGKKYANRVRIKPGDPIDTDVLLNDVAWISRNPFRRADVFLRPGEQVGVTDIELEVEDRVPLQIYSGIDNTGTEPTGRTRWFAGGTWGDAFFLDHILTYQYTAGTDIRKYQSHTGHYTAPLPWRHLLILYGGYARMRPDIEGDFDALGSTTQGSIRYTAPYGTNYKGSLQEITVGFDFKNTNNNLIFVGEEEIALITKTVNLTQFVAGYALGRENDLRKLSFNLDLYYSPAQFLPNQTESDYSNLSPHAKPKYIYGNICVAETWYLPKTFELFLQARLQLASEVLLQSEQFGLGGYDTVRGYEEREFNADNALCTNVELRTPSMSIIRFFKDCPKFDDRFYFLIFFDYGLGNLNDRHLRIDFVNENPHIPKFEHLMGVGPGFRYTIFNRLSARLDWGLKLHRTVFSDAARSKWHFGLILNF